MRRLLAGCAQAARSCVSKKTRYRLVGRVAKCPELRANCVNHQPLRPLVGYHVLPISLLPLIVLKLIILPLSITTFIEKASPII